MTFYEFLLGLHSIVRWLVLAAAVYAIFRALSGWLGRKDWSKADKTAGLLFTSILDTQLLAGLILYFVSPITSGALRTFGAAMKNAVTRFFLVEHSALMLVAVIVAHIGWSMAKKAGTDLSKFRRMALWFLGSLALVLAAIPWDRLFK